MSQANGWQDAIVAIVVLVVNAGEPHSTELHAIDDVQSCFRQALIRDDREHWAKLTWPDRKKQHASTHTQTHRYAKYRTQIHKYTNTYKESQAEVDQKHLDMQTYMCTYSEVH